MRSSSGAWILEPDALVAHLRDGGAALFPTDTQLFTGPPPPPFGPKGLGGVFTPPRPRPLCLVGGWKPPPPLPLLAPSSLCPPWTQASKSP